MSVFLLWLAVILTVTAVVGAVAEYGVFVLAARIRERGER